jgi:chromate reductase
VQILAVSGSLRAGSYSTSLLRAAIEAAPDGVEVELFDPAAIADLPLYDQDLDGEDVPEPVQRLRDEWASADAILFATPEYNGSVPGGLKNAIDWASRPRDQNAFAQMPAAVIGASTGRIGTALAQQSLRAVLSYCNARQMTAPEAYIHFSDELFPGNGVVTAASTEAFLRDYMANFREYIVRVLTVLPRG